MSALSWDMFLKNMTDFVKISDKLNDFWTMEGNCEEVGGSYLKKIITQYVVENTLDDCINMNELMEKQKHPRHGLLRWEYHVYYNLSYSVPVLCFNVWNEDGSLLRLEEVWENCRLTSQEPAELYSALTQQDHPILLRPFFTIHPCKTSEILNISDSGDNNCNSIIRFLSAIGPMVGLKLDLSYATALWDSSEAKQT